jgi:hypothetical protein
MTAQLPSRERLAEIHKLAAKSDKYIYHLRADEVEAMTRFVLAAYEQEPVAYSLIFRNMDGVLNSSINTNTTFSTREKAEAYGRGGRYETQPDGSLKWVADENLDPVVVPLYTRPAPVPAVSMPEDLHHDTKKLVCDFASALAEKLYKAQLKYGYSANWKNSDWQAECLKHFHQHIGKGDLVTLQPTVHSCGSMDGKLSSSASSAVPELVSVVGELTSAIRSINRAPHHIAKGVDDDEPCYWQRKEWIDWMLELASSADEKAALPCSTGVNHERRNVVD